MREQLPALLVIIPWLAALLAPLAAYLSLKLARWLSLGAVLASLACSVEVLVAVLEQGNWHYHFGGWLPPFGIEFAVAPLSAGMACLISFLSFLVLVYTQPFLAAASWLEYGAYHAAFVLLTGGLLGMVVTGDVFNLFVFLEIASLAAYALIAAGGDRATVAAFRYLLVGTVGASLYLLSIGYLYAVTGTLNMADLAARIQPLLSSPAVLVAITMMAVGLGIKMALFPLHGWQPDAYSYGHPAAMGFIAGIMTKVSVYVLLRFFFFVFGAGNQAVAAALEVLSWLAVAGIIFGSVMAIAQSDFRRLLAYSSVAQIGYIVLGLGLGNLYGLIGAVIHLVNHAVMKSCLFLVAGGVQWRTGEQTVEKYVQLCRRMPWTMAALVLAALSMVGIPPTAGFFSKWYLVLGAIEANRWLFVAVIALSSLLNALYFFRILENVYLKKGKEEARGLGGEPDRGGRRAELPLTMLLPILILGMGILVLGIYNQQLVSQVLLFAIPEGVQ